ncbi:MAG: DinB family protein [Saprospirales bacterium]|nr:DinB family protein [Saprospirales bacterium]
MQKLFAILPLLALWGPFFAQITVDTMEIDTLPYREIPAYPDTFSAENVAARMIDGLGFRFYWVTESLRPEDLAYKPSPDARTCEETIDHILGLSQTILNAVEKKPNVRREEEDPSLSFDEKRKQVLHNLKTASDLLKNTDETLADFPIIFEREDSRSEFPFWNMLNGPLADAIWHTGQVVSFRRASGNPYNSKASLFTGKVRD